MQELPDVSLQSRRGENGAGRGRRHDEGKKEASSSNFQNNLPLHNIITTRLTTVIEVNRRTPK
eukprot:scaffold6387_cov201-Alexandrium_tamarense.AAC.13